MPENDSLEQRAKESHVRHSDPAECGAACLHALIRYYGEDLDWPALNALATGGEHGTTLKDLHLAAQQLGFKSGAYTARIGNLMELKAPAILHLVRKNGSQQFAVCYGFTGTRFVVGDPEDGVRKIIPKQLADLWQSGALLTVEPSAEFSAILRKFNRRSSRTLREDPVKDAATRYSCRDVSVAQVGANQVLLSAGSTGEGMIVPSDEARVLLSFEKFYTVEQGLERMLRTSGGIAPGLLPKTPGGVPAVEQYRKMLTKKYRKRLVSFVQKGLLLSETQVLDRIRQVGETLVKQVPELLNITALGIPTGGRPENLRRAVTGYAENAGHFGRTLHLVIADDSCHTGHQQKTREAIGAIHTSPNIRLSYIDRERRRNYADQVADYLSMDVNLVRFALLGDPRCEFTAGAARNTLLLETAGNLSIQADDDTVCRLAPSPVGEDGLTLSSGAEVNQYWLYPDEDAVLRDVPFVDLDFLSLHEQALGRSPAVLVSTITQKAGKVTIEALRPEREASLGQPEVGVGVTFLGLIGDSAMGTHGNLARLFLDGASFRRLVADEAGYRQRLRTRYVRRAPAGTVLTDNPACMTMNIGLDQRAPIPPFMPVNRNEDGVFGSLHTLCCRGSWKGYLPYMLLHQPPDHREHPAQIARSVAPPRLNDLLRWIILGYESWPAGSDPGRNLQSMGRYLAEFGHLGKKDFSHGYRELTLHALGGYLMLGERRLLEHTDGPEYWKKDLEEYLSVYRSKICEDDFLIPWDLPGSREERLGLFQDLVRRFGELLIAWPDILSAARDLKARGIQPAVPVKEVHV